MRTVIHLTSDDAGDVEHAIRCTALLRGHDELSHDDVTLLAHRGAIRAVASESPFGDEVADLLERGVTVVCGATCFDAFDLPREALSGVDVVPSGVSELVRLQSEGYNYVKIP